MNNLMNKTTFFTLVTTVSLFAGAANAGGFQSPRNTNVNVNPNKNVNINPNVNVNKNVNGGNKSANTNLNRNHNSSSSRSRLDADFDVNSKSRSNSKSKATNTSTNNTAVDSGNAVNSETSSTSDSSGGNSSNSYNTEGSWALSLPDVYLNYPQLTNPGSTMACGDFMIQFNYTEGNTTGINLYVLSFMDQDSPSTLPDVSVTMAQSIALTCLNERLHKLLPSSGFTQAEQEGYKQTGIQLLMESMFGVAGKADEYTGREVEYNSINQTPSGVGDDLTVNVD